MLARLNVGRIVKGGLLVVGFAIISIISINLANAATDGVATEAEAGTTSTMAFTLNEPGASGNQAVQFGSNITDCNNFCSIPKNPIFKTSPVTINTKVNTAWCGPTWDAPQAEFDLARQKLGAGAILLPPCKPNGGYHDTSPEQYKTLLDKAQVAGVKVLVFGGYVCSNAYDHYCYGGFTNPDGFIDKFAYHPALAGFFIHDEPKSQEFADTQKAVERIQLRRPGLIAYTNLLGSFGSLDPKGGAYGTNSSGPITYDQYISSFIDTVKVNVISVDDYTSPTALDFTLKTIDGIVKQKQPSRPDLANYSLWSAISTIGLTNGQTKEYFDQNRPAYQAANDKYGAKTLSFTWRAPPVDGVWTQPATGPALCGLVNNDKPGTMCGN
jgi:hypothetical protein